MSFTENFGTALKTLELHRTESEKTILSHTIFESSNLHSQIQSALRTKPKYRAGLAGSLILIPCCARGREQRRIRIILFWIPRCARGREQRRIRIILILIPRCALGGTQRRIIELGWILTDFEFDFQRCARGWEEHQIRDFVRILDFDFDPALRPGRDTAQDHNHKLCDPALR